MHKTLTRKRFEKWGEQNMKEAYIEKINEEMRKTEDIELLDLIHKLLINSNAKWLYYSANTAMLPVGGVAVKFWVTPLEMTQNSIVWNVTETTTKPYKMQYL